MTDNKPAEHSAESLVIHHLLKYGIKTTKPFFDENGTDLLLIDQVSRGATAFLRAQCKYRRYAKGNPSSVTIPASYMSANFVLFLYVINDDDTDGLMVFFEEDLVKWRLNDQEKYFLSISDKSVTELHSHLISRAVANQLVAKLKRVEIKRYTTLLIDGIFLEKAIKATKAIYSEIWPDRVLQKPELMAIIRQFLYYYNRHPDSKADIQCVLFLSDDFHLEHWVTMPQAEPRNFKLSIFRSGKIISFEILDYMERVINTENILLVADDIVYESPLNKLKDAGTDVILIRLETALGGNLYTQHQWGDVTYPLGLAMGLEPNEL